MTPLLDVRLTSDFDSMEQVDKIVDELTRSLELSEETNRTPANGSSFGPCVPETIWK
jgi:hypothetical protein